MHSLGLCLRPETCTIHICANKHGPHLFVFVFVCACGPAVPSCVQVVYADVCAWLCHRHVKPVYTGLWGPRRERRVLTACVHVHPAVCAPGCPLWLSPPSRCGSPGRGLPVGQGRAQLLLRWLGPCWSLHAASPPASRPSSCHLQKKSQAGFAEGHGFLQLSPEQRCWAGHGTVISPQPWHQGHQGQHRARWGSEIRGPDANNSKAKAAKALGQKISRHAPSGGTPCPYQGGHGQGRSSPCPGAVGDSVTPCCSVPCVLLAAKQG